MGSNTDSNKTSKRSLWEHPWKYKESFIISFGLLFLGFVIEYFTDSNSIWLPAWPTNLIIIVAFWAYFIFLDRFVKHPIVKWLSSTPAAISSISVFTFLILLMGFILQTNEDTSSFISKLGLTHVTSSWPYLLTSFFLMIILGLTISRRFFPINIKNFAFFLNHGGLWLVIATASLGSADSWKMSMVLNEGEPTNYARDYKSGNIYEMPFSLELTKFDIEEFPPNIGLYGHNEERLIIDKGDKLMDCEEGQNDKLGDWDVSVKTYYPEAVLSGDKYIASKTIGSVHAVYIIAKNTINGEIMEGWVTSGSMMYSPEYLTISTEQSIVVTIPSPKEYSSEMIATMDDGQKQDVFIRVNGPASIENWTIYQVSYDDTQGKWSKTSIVEVVRDPWLPVVYVGIFMILAGSLYLAWMGRMKI